MWQQAWGGVQSANRCLSVPKAIGDFQARLILSVFYFIIVGPFALILRWAADPLSLKKGAQQTWRVKTESKDPPLKRAMNQF